jgi:ActR/RegA family two-component response regulator
VPIIEVEHLHKRYRDKVLVLTTCETDRDVLPAIKAGATGYLLKDATQQELLRAVGPRPGASRCCRRRSRPGCSARSAPPWPSR